MGMLNRFKAKINEIYLDSTIPYNNISKKMVCALKQRITKEDFKTFQKLKKLKKKQNNLDKKIRIVFLLQMPEVWGKQQIVYEEMKKRDNIETIIFTIPEYDIKTGGHRMRHIFRKSIEVKMFWNMQKPVTYHMQFLRLYQVR